MIGIFRFCTIAKIELINIMTENEIAKILVDLFLKIHRKLGPGLLESVYEEVVCYELRIAGIKFCRQKGIKVTYDDVALDIGFRADIIIEVKVIVELK